jgi:carbon-monoxide dehydrogenase large subunit
MSATAEVPEKMVGKALKRWEDPRLISGAASFFDDVRLPRMVHVALVRSPYYDPPDYTFPFGTHICVVEVDRDSGEIDPIRYLAVDDGSNVVNPLIVDGQLHGGIAQSLAQALYEGAHYDDDGQLMTRTMSDYAIPKAHQDPYDELDRTVTPTPVNPLGVNGAGEAGTIASTPAVANAVIDALSHLGVTHLYMPITPEKVWREIERAG